MFIREATLEDIPDLIDLFRTEVFPSWGRKKLPHDPAKVEGFLRERFHEDRFMMVLAGGEIAGLLWTKIKKIPGMYKVSLLPIMYVIAREHKRTGIGAALVYDAEKYAFQNGYQHLTISTLRNTSEELYYRGKGFTELQRPEAGIAQAPRERRRHWGPGR